MHCYYNSEFNNSVLWMLLNMNYCSLHIYTTVELDNNLNIVLRVVSDLYEIKH
jgi:hypothetical protein